MSDIVTVFTAGKFVEDKGGGWCAILGYKDNYKEIKGFATQTTKARMELVAVIAALRHLKRPCQVKMIVTSQELHNIATNKWQTSSNTDLWQMLANETAKHRVVWCVAERRAFTGLMTAEKACDDLIASHEPEYYYVAANVPESVETSESNQE